MEHNILFVLILGIFHSCFGDLSSVVDSCCSVGTSLAASNDNCDNLYTAVPATISHSDVIMCQNVIEVCCLKSKQKEMCDRGKRAALDGEACAIRNDLIAAVTYQECCHCCDLGLAVRQMGMRCTPPSIGNPCDSQFIECCRGQAFISPDEPGDSEGGEIADVDECTVFGANELCSHICVNTIGSFRCECQRGYKLAADNSTCFRDDCQRGFAFNTLTRRCEDVDECTIGTHNCNGPNEICNNRQGWFYCDCDDGFYRNRETMRCEDIDECARSMDTCTSSQRCENTPGSFVCRRIIPCGTGWTLDEETQACVDQNECEIGTHNCGPGYECYNIEGSFRCNPRRCPEGSRFSSASGQCERIHCSRGLRADASLNCIDINECEESNPCASHQTCQNSYGSYRCIDSINCPAGYQANRDGVCEDIDECLTGQHDCQGGSECVNRPGSYVCSCPSGYTRQGAICVDRNECLFGSVCPNTARCENTPGSYRCLCDNGFELVGNNECRDINECEDNTLCAQQCVNLPGSFTCSCDIGYRLGQDRRSCIDIDECNLYSGPGVCSGTCVNTPGSYQCSCPSGWRIMGNYRSCQDIDECEEGLDRCGSNEDVMCFNTRGSYRCPRVDCPSGFSRSALGPRRNSVRCKRLSFTCRQGDTECLNAPLSLSYNFLTFPTNVKIPTDLFSMSGPSTADKAFDWHLNVTSALPRQANVRPAVRQNFDLQIGTNYAVVALVDRLEGPQDIELTLTMEITDVYSRYTGHAISKIYLYVTTSTIS